MPSIYRNGIKYSGAGESGARVTAGTIVPFAGATAPTGWLMCDGSAVSRTTYSELFNVIGTTYGGGDGSTTFNLPDLTGRFPLGSGTGDASDATAHTLGSKNGTETVTLNTNQIPSHAHTIKWENYSRVVGQVNTMGHIAQGSGTNAGNSENTGGGQAHNNMPPYNTVNYIISTGTGVGTVVNDVKVNGSSVVSGGVATVNVPTVVSDLTNDSGFISEDANGDISITRNITAGGDVTDGAGNVLSTKVSAATVSGSTTGSTSVASGSTFVNIGSITLPPGLWIVRYMASFQSNATGSREIALGQTSSDRTTPTAQACNGRDTKVVGVAFLDLSSATGNTTRNVYARHNAGTELNVYPAITALRLY